MIGFIKNIFSKINNDKLKELKTEEVEEIPPETA